MSKAISDLMNDHEAILSAIQILEMMVTGEKRNAPVKKEDVQDFIGFLKEFADKCHHGKEEDILFPAMIGAGVADKGGPIGVMMSEHTQGRQFVREMEDSLQGSVDEKKLAQAAMGYITLLRQHISKENMVLFPMAERVFSEDQLDMLAGKFEEHEEKVIGHGRHEELHAMLHDLQIAYGVK
jgi:hemerythrin-like domain-containing protein